MLVVFDRATTIVTAATTAAAAPTTSTVTNTATSAATAECDCLSSCSARFLRPLCFLCSYDCCERAIGRADRLLTLFVFGIVLAVACLNVLRSINTNMHFLFMTVQFARLALSRRHLD